VETRKLGRTGLRVPVLCLGTMTFGLQCDRDASFAILDRALEGGLDFLDTADVYPLGGGLDTVGRTEEILGEWMRERGVRERIVLATKCCGPMGKGPNEAGLSRQHIVAAAEASLRRLRTDWIDLYQSHAFDGATPIEETLRAFDDLVRAGKVRYIGCSNYPAWRLAGALRAADRLGVAGYGSVQPRYNLLYREIETELLPLCRAEGLGVLVYNPLAGGFLSGKHTEGAEPEAGGRFTLGTAAGIYRHRYWQEAQFRVVERLAKECEARGVSLVSAAVAWVLGQEGVTSAIIGASRPAQLDASLAAAALKLDPELKKLLDDAWWQLPRRPVIEGYR
jgi:aryl-alcohol dehydrogenase-like predicted oxidoreductase